MESQHGFLLVLLAFLLFVSGMMLQPFLGYVLGATILAFMLMPVQDRLSTHIGSALSALVLIVLTLAAVILPFALIVRNVAKDAEDIIVYLDDNAQSLDLDKWEAMIRDTTGIIVNLEQEARRALNTFASVTLGGLPNVLNVISGIAVGFSILIFTLYYLLKDGNNFVKYVEGVVPLPKKMVNDLLSKTYCTTWAVIKNHVFIAVLQGLVAGVGLWITSVPNFVFWTFVMILMAFVPIVGTFLVWGPAAVHLAITSKPVEGLVLARYGLVVVALTDNVLRAAIVNEGVELHPAVILIGVVGGVYVFGAPGLLLGPVIFGILKAVLEVF